MSHYTIETRALIVEKSNSTQTIPLHITMLHIDAEKGTKKYNRSSSNNQLCFHT
jgi:hypothetical protein